MLPSSTYRLQFRNGFDFDEAVAIVPYLKELGISHLYASPIFSATRGSTHGYDVTDHNEIDPTIGGRAGFDRLSAALRQAGLGLILDIVPNHMAASLENQWWRSVIELGQGSPYARHFDIDWRERLTLPILGKPFDQAVADGEIVLKMDAGQPVLAYFDNLFPLHPDTCADIDEQMVASADAAFLADLHAKQRYQLTFWKEARRHLSYRRFFEVTGLVGVRVEDPAVFADVHRLILELVKSGQVDGLRVDHVDGLADPKTYLDELRQAIGPDTYLVVEKILNGDEVLAQDWAIEGTTGYEFIAAAADLLIDGDKADALEQAYAQALGGPVDLEAERRRAKQVMVTENFETELKGLVRLAQDASDGSLADEAIRDAIAAIVVAFPVYRSYINADGVRAEDQALLDRVAGDAKASGTAQTDAVDRVLALLTDASPSATAAEFRTRFQQLTGPVTAKSVEDTLFYRFNRLIAMNEVGCDPAEPAGSVERFHAKMAARVQEQPHGLLGTSTHDTKRGEDARARLYALSEAPNVWAGAVARWRDMHAGLVKQLADGPAPEPDTEWMLYQALLGIWTGDKSPAALAGLEERFLPYVEKALREAKRRTDWSDNNEAYEAAVTAYAKRLFAPDNTAFHDDFAAVIEPFVSGGHINSLSQTLIKLTAPGIPDIYQGAEAEDLSVVDPDNRRAIEFDVLQSWLAAAPRSWAEQISEGSAKQRLIRAGLALRSAKPALFAEGGYVPLPIEGNARTHAVAFMREHDGEAVLAVAPRLPLALYGKAQVAEWGNTMVPLPRSLIGRPLRNVLTGTIVEAGETLRLADLLRDCPIALLASE